MITRLQIEAHAADAGRWGQMLEQAADNARWMLALQDPPLDGWVRQRVEIRLEQATEMARRCRAEEAMWRLLLVDPPAALQPTTSGQVALRRTLAKWERDVVV